VNGVERGSLIIADISGYTKYLTGVELEHSTDILADLINTIVEQMRGHFTLAKLEGDAIFCYSNDGPRDEADTLLTAIEGSYFAFRQRQTTIDRATSCTCDACSRIPTLNLKFVVHHGSYAIHEVAGNRELLGADVIVIHRLLKNEIVHTTGVRAYAFFSGDCLEHYGIKGSALTLTPHVETYEDVGEVAGWVLNLDARWTEEQERREVRIPDDDPKAMALTYELTAPPPVLWEYLTSPSKRLEWQEGTTDFLQNSPRGTRGVGTVNHCMHGKQTIHEEILDWKPYRYVTHRTTMPGVGPFLMVFDLTPLEDADRTRLVVKMRPEGGLKQKLLLKAIGGKIIAGFNDGIAKLEGILSKEREPAARPG
jgi:uncharacterized protein YndB with AHSA1/START domain